MTTWAAAIKNAKDNPDVEWNDQMNEDLSAAVSGRTGHVTVDTGDKSAFSAQFEQMWTVMGGPDLEHEFKFYTTRRWRFDYCHLPTRTVIELEGGAYSGGRHTRPGGFVADCEKYNAAARCGYTVFRLATGMVTPENIEMIIDHINVRQMGGAL